MIIITSSASAQDPVLPATNLGTSNVFDGFAGNSAKAVEKLEKDIELALKTQKVWITIK